MMCQSELTARQSYEDWHSRFEVDTLLPFRSRVRRLGLRVTLSVITTAVHQSKFPFLTGEAHLPFGLAIIR